MILLSVTTQKGVAIHRWALILTQLVSRKYDMDLSPQHHILLCLSTYYNDLLVDHSMFHAISKTRNAYIVRLPVAVEISGKV